ncbi:MAG TPA: FAD/NAD(P)-binding protein [Thermodesulfobacteriota bacterium]|nr:FAD/NAD(P)-binding protein [Thermodesulfobacteriota bacterium]
MKSPKKEPASPYLPKPSIVREARQVTEKEKFFSIELPSPMDHSPGQFLMLGIPGFGEAPISISSPPSGGALVELCVRAVGNVTNALHRLVPGDTVWVRGPFGRGFPVDKMRRKDMLFIAGGIGLVPMRSLIKSVLAKRDSFGRLTLLYGVKTPHEILFKDEFEDWTKKGLDIKITIDKPHPEWKGNVGVVTTLMGEVSVDEKNSIAVLIGPPVMYKYVILSLGNKKLEGEDIFLSLERRMKCGVGKCGHCQIQSVYACQEGPVFNLSEIRHLREAI